MTQISTPISVKFEIHQNFALFEIKAFEIQILPLLKKKCFKLYRECLVAYDV